MGFIREPEVFYLLGGLRCDKREREARLQRIRLADKTLLLSLASTCLSDE